MEGNVTLEEMLFFREEKVRRQDELRREHEGGTVVALGMNIPGPRKISPAVLKAFHAGGDALSEVLAREGLQILAEDVIMEKQGYLKLYAVGSPDPLSVKKITVRLEETHPLGRLFDIDVYDEAGRGLGREELGAPPRRCLICGKDGKLCGRNRSHTVEALYARVEEIIDMWLNV
ncbi:citrate lyase holo-[acyl-carrier protein] synthase [Lachnospiraceae bacterium 54-53]